MIHLLPLDILCYLSTSFLHGYDLESLFLYLKKCIPMHSLIRLDIILIEKLEILRKKKRDFLENPYKIESDYSMMDHEDRRFRSLVYKEFINQKRYDHSGTTCFPGIKYSYYLSNLLLNKPDWIYFADVLTIIVYHPKLHSRIAQFYRVVGDYIRQMGFIINHQEVFIDYFKLHNQKFLNSLIRVLKTKKPEIQAFALKLKASLKDKN